MRTEETETNNSIRLVGKDFFYILHHTFLPSLTSHEVFRDVFIFDICLNSLIVLLGLRGRHIPNASSCTYSITVNAASPKMVDLNMAMGYFDNCSL